MIYIKTNDWIPSPGITLDDKALEIIKTDSSCTITAGPGSGKTELLAQRATYLLSTGLCPVPNRILAIAFKVDAAQNLRSRVAMRCDELHAQRFESRTLDEFAKKIVDQFLEALPNKLRPSPNYTIFFPNRNIWDAFRQNHQEKYSKLYSINIDELDKILDKSVPNFDYDNLATFSDKIQNIWWQSNLQSSPSRLTFNMIKCLAIHILKIEPKILSALRQTYTHVFLDEFQDVTDIQYSLIKEAFLGSKSILTAVGDINQSIMGWAGASKEIFDRFETDFNARNEQVQNNFRSNSRIVDLINDLASTFAENYLPVKCARINDVVPENAVGRWVFETREKEGEHLASLISNELAENPNLSQSDFLILARLRVNDIEDRIKQKFQIRGLSLRNEARMVGGIAIQDLVSEIPYRFLLSATKLALNVREGQPFQECSNFISELRGLDLNDEKGHSETLNVLRNLIRDLEDHIGNKKPIEVSGSTITDLVFNHINKGEIRQRYRQYTGNERLMTIIDGFSVFFDECRKETTEWTNVIADMEGTNAIRLMTIHKSKGLEYHTVFFLEFNDDAFWGNEDDINVFFVALSRARERVYFSFTRDSKGSNNVSELTKKLEIAKVPLIESVD